jgi:two-component sensor histidine kinase
MDVADIKVGIDTAIPCGLIINELVTNALKYAFPKGQSGWVKVAMHLLDDAGIELLVQDNGVGLPEDCDLERSNSLGLQLVSVLVHDQLSGKLELIRSNGTLFRVVFKEVES